MRITQTEDGKYEVTYSVKFTLDPVMVGFDLSVSDMDDEVRIALGQITHAERAELVARLH